MGHHFRAGSSIRSIAVFSGLAPFMASAQSLVDAEHLGAARAAFDAPPQAPALKCQFSAVEPALSYSLRLETGFSVEIPLKQFQGAGHGWDVLLRVTPEGREPVFLTVSQTLAEAPNWKDGEFKGMFLVGEGGYGVDALLKDDEGRVCKSSWRVQARLEGEERSFAPSLAAGSVAEASARPGVPMRGRSHARVTALVHAASFVPGHAKIGEDDVQAFAGSLETLLERVGLRSVRVVVFDLEESAPLYENDDFRMSDLDTVAKALAGAQLGVISYDTLKNRRGPVETTAELVRSELARPDAPDALVLIGPYSPIPAGASTSIAIRQSLEPANLFYLQYRQYQRRERAMPDAEPGRVRSAAMGVPLPLPTVAPPQRPDALAIVTRAMKGETIAVFRPHEFAGAIRHILNRLSAK
jgi:hypothetical protein